jgi:hypothetical protein
MLKILGSKDDELNEILFCEGAEQVCAKFVFCDHALHKSLEFQSVFRVIDTFFPHNMMMRWLANYEVPLLDAFSSSGVRPPGPLRIWRRSIRLSLLRIVPIRDRGLQE